MDVLSGCMDAHIIENVMKTAENATQNVKTCQIRQRMQNSPKAC